MKSYSSDTTESKEICIEGVQGLLEAVPFGGPADHGLFRLRNEESFHWAVIAFRGAGIGIDGYPLSFLHRGLKSHSKFPIASIVSIW